MCNAGERIFVKYRYNWDSVAGVVMAHLALCLASLRRGIATLGMKKAQSLRGGSSGEFSDNVRKYDGVCNHRGSEEAENYP